jgi:hypothetical protein
MHQFCVIIEIAARVMLTGGFFIVVFLDETGTDVREESNRMFGFAFFRRTWYTVTNNRE